MSVNVSDKIFSPPELLGQFEEQIAGAGAVVSFSGYVRGAGADRLILSHYPGFTQNAMAQIGQEAERRWPLSAWRIHHRVGEMSPGEAIVFVAAASAHRRAAFEAADFMMDKLKSEAPLWKQEKCGDKTLWIEPRAQDYHDKERWS